MYSKHITDEIVSRAPIPESSMSCQFCLLLHSNDVCDSILPRSAASVPGSTDTQDFLFPLCPEDVTYLNRYFKLKFCYFCGGTLGISKNKQTNKQTIIANIIQGFYFPSKYIKLQSKTVSGPFRPLTTSSRRFYNLPTCYLQSVSLESCFWGRHACFLGVS